MKKLMLAVVLATVLLATAVTALTYEQRVREVENLRQMQQQMDTLLQRYLEVVENLPEDQQAPYLIRYSQLQTISQRVPPVYIAGEEFSISTEVNIQEQRYESLLTRRNVQVPDLPPTAQSVAVLFDEAPFDDSPTGTAFYVNPTATLYKLEYLENGDHRPSRTTRIITNYGEENVIEAVVGRKLTHLGVYIANLDNARAFHPDDYLIYHWTIPTGRVEAGGGDITLGRNARSLRNITFSASDIGRTVDIKMWIEVEDVGAGNDDLVELTWRVKVVTADNHAKSRLQRYLPIANAHLQRLEYGQARATLNNIEDDYNSVKGTIPKPNEAREYEGIRDSLIRALVADGQQKVRMGSPIAAQEENLKDLHRYDFGIASPVAASIPTKDPVSGSYLENNNELKNLVKNLEEMIARAAVNTATVVGHVYNKTSGVALGKALTIQILKSDNTLATFSNVSLPAEATCDPNTGEFKIEGVVVALGQNYKIHIEPDDDYEMPSDTTITLRPGETATATIIVFPKSEVQLQVKLDATIDGQVPTQEVKLILKPAAGGADVQVTIPTNTREVTINPTTHTDLAAGEYTVTLDPAMVNVNNFELAYPTTKVNVQPRRLTYIPVGLVTETALQKGGVRFYVTDQNRQPLDGVKINIFDTATSNYWDGSAFAGGSNKIATILTDVNGVITLSDIPVGQYMFTLEKDSYATHSRPYTVFNSVISEKRITMSSEMGTFNGRVTLPDGRGLEEGLDIGRAAGPITADEAKIWYVQIDEPGNAGFIPLAPNSRGVFGQTLAEGTYDFEVRAVDNVFDRFEKKNVQIVAGQEKTEPFELQTVSLGRITGKITDASGTVVVSKTGVITLQDTGNNIVQSGIDIDANGYYRIENVPEGTYYIIVVVPDYPRKTTETFNVAKGQTIPMDIQLVAAPTEKRTLTVTVQYTATNPAPGATVVVQRASGAGSAITRNTDASGRVIFSDLEPAADYTITANLESASGVETADLSVADGTKTITLQTYSAKEQEIIQRLRELRATQTEFRAYREGDQEELRGIQGRLAMEGLPDDQRAGELARLKELQNGAAKLVELFTLIDASIDQVTALMWDTTRTPPVRKHPTEADIDSVVNDINTQLTRINTAGTEYKNLVKRTTP